MRPRNIFLGTVALTLALATVADAAWIQYANRVRRPNGNLAHADAVTQRVVVTEEAEATQLCFDYRNQSSKKSQGKVAATVSVSIPDQDVQTFRLSAGVSKNTASKCAEGPAMPVGTIVDFDFEFTNMPLVLGKKGHFSDVRGIVSGAEDGEIARPALTPADDEEAGRIVSASATYLPEKESEKHPGSTFLALVPARDMVEPTLCVLYHNDLDKKNKGRVVTKVTVTRGEDDVESLTLSDKVNRNTSEDCRVLEGGDIPAGAMIEFDIDFNNIPKLKMDGDSSNYADVNALISSAGEATFVAPEVSTDDAPSGGGGGGGGDDPPPSGGISADDQRAVSRLLLSNTKVQLQRPKGNSPSRFVALGPRSRTLPNDSSKVDPATAGYGNTIAVALADYERKMGSVGGNAALLSSRDLAEIQWYASMNTASGPTAIRRDAGGGWHSEYWRPGTGSVFNKAGSMAAVIELLRRQGL